MSRSVILAAKDAKLAAAVAAAAQEFRKLRLERASMADIGRLAEAGRRAAAMVVQIDPAADGAVEDFQRLTRALPERLVIAAVLRASGEELRRLFRAGAADVLTAPFSAEAVNASLTELLRAQSGPAASRGRVVSIVKACGGAGATTLAANLAALLAEGDTRRSRPARRTALLDLDLQFGDADLALDLQPKSGLVDVLRSPERVDGRFLQSVLTEHSSGLKLLAAPGGLLPTDALGPDLAETLLDLAAERFERVVVDLPAAWTDWSLRVLARSDLIVLVSPPTVGGALGARRVLDALAQAEAQRPLLFVLNRLSGLVEALEKPSRIGKTLELAVDASLPLEPAAAKANDRGKLVIEALPKARLTKELRGLAAKLEDRLDAAAPTTSQASAAPAAEALA